MHHYGKGPLGPDVGTFARSFAAFGMGGPGPGVGPAGRARRGDIRPAVLRVLADQPMHGYQIIQEISARSGGTWNPSAGSVYPTLQLLADEGLVVAEETGGKRVFSLTAAGEAAVADLADEQAPWDVAAASPDLSGYAALRQAGGRLAAAVLQVGRSGDKNQIVSTIEILNAARKQVYTLLAQD
ncbi:PadR family transcriptional regulator [Cellulomonas alba]|uniref:PadR family transcriptional regulator n=1 Tax=Cellulomonas alba TaxID=3053467 RepID=A0ABT7SDC2_9CELL|nr:PadR family transcriptional regulator [Cellulomonas alba]MDM7854175.1 PadR family transcriptional regulator [Cellulomonas alba]